jgi:hypothetical protein
LRFLPSRGRAGRPENSSLAGLPETYIVRQVADFTRGARKSSVPERLPVAAMISVSRAATDAEVASAAGYFANLRPRKIITVVERTSFPKTHIAGWFLAPVNDKSEKDRQPTGDRIIGVPKDLERFESRDSRSHFIAISSGDSTTCNTGRVADLTMLPWRRRPPFAGWART